MLEARSYLTGEITVEQGFAFTAPEGQTAGDTIYAVHDTDPDATAIVVAVDWGDNNNDNYSSDSSDSGCTFEAGEGEFDIFHGYPDSGSYDATVTITDSQNNSTQFSFLALIGNVGPSLNVLTLSSSQIALTWPDVQPGSAGYRIERSGNGGQSFDVCEELLDRPGLIFSGSDVTWTDPSADADTSFSYRVRAIASSTDISTGTAFSTPMTAITFTDSAPVLTVAAGSATVSLTWSDPTLHETGWSIEKSAHADFSDEETILIAPSDGDQASYTDEEVVDGVVYYYQVTATADGGDGWQSPVSNPVVTLTRPAGPGIVWAHQNATDPGLIDVGWGDFRGNLTSDISDNPNRIAISVTGDDDKIFQSSSGAVGLRKYNVGDDYSNTGNATPNITVDPVTFVPTNHTNGFVLDNVGSVSAVLDAINKESRGTGNHTYGAYEL